ncbi:MAG: ABC transporter permease, partial [Actinomycetota bacterium]
AAERARPSAIARALNAITSRPAPAIGARLALEPGRGLTAVPIRSSLAAAVTGIVALLATISIGASIDHLLASPELFGWTWDADVTGEFAPGSKDLTNLIDDPAFASVGLGFGGEGVVFRMRPAGNATFEISTAGLTTDSVKGTFGPPVLQGRAPRQADEVALGSRTMKALGVSLGDSVEIAIQGGQIRKPFRVVGTVVLPLEGDISSVGEGAWMTLAGVHPLDPEIPPVPQVAFIRFAPGIDRDGALKRLRERYAEIFEPFTPGLVRDFRRISDLMVVMAALLAALAAGTLIHMLTTSIRRRRRDLSILKTLGFSRRQLRSTVGWQAVVFTTVALLVAVPVGIVVGRWTWNLIARYQGIAAVPVVPPIAFTIVGFATIVAALVISVLPARSAARSRPALELRAE